MHIRVVPCRSLCLLVCAAALGSAGHAGACSRQLSRDVRSVLDEQVFTVLSVNRSSLPANCLLRLEGDLFHDHEAHKSISARSGYHKCGYCNKTFSTEYYLDRHMDLRHMDQISPENHFCLGDLSQVLGLMPRVERGVPHRAGAFPAAHTGGKCTPATLEKVSYQCASLARSCFGRESDDVNEFIALVCSRLACRRGQLVGLAEEAAAENTSVLRLVGAALQIISAIIIIIGLAVYAWNMHRTWFQSAAYNSRVRERSALGRKFWAFFKFSKSQ